MMSLTFGLFTQVSDSGPQGPLVFLGTDLNVKNHENSVTITPLLCDNNALIVTHCVVKK